MKSGHRLGPNGYALVLSQFARQPTSWHQLIALGLAGEQSAPRIARGMHRLGLIHIAGWIAEPHRPLTPLYSIGAGSDAAPPSRRPSGERVKGMTKPRRPHGVPVQLIAFQMVVEALQVALSLNELRAETELTWGSCDATVKALRAAGLAYIEGWRHSPFSGKHRVAHYAFGRGKDVVKPPRDRIAARRRFAERQREREALMPLLRLGDASNTPLFQQRA